jgi:hypothetical protein
MQRVAAKNIAHRFLGLPLWMAMSVRWPALKPTEAEGSTMDLALFTRNRLKRLRLGPRNLARATSMTESYIAHVLAPNSSETASNRTDMQDQLERVQHLPEGQLAKLADLQRREFLNKRMGNQPSPLLHRRTGPFGVF